MSIRKSRHTGGGAFIWRTGMETFDREVYESLKIIGKVTDNEKRAEALINFFKNIEVDLNKRKETLWITAIQFLYHKHRYGGC